MRQIRHDNGIHRHQTVSSLKQTGNEVTQKDFVPGTNNNHYHILKMSDFDSILENGINFGRGGERQKQDDKVKTKAKKKKYITGAHGSGSAMQKAKYRKQRANRKHK